MRLREAEQEERWRQEESDEWRRTGLTCLQVSSATEPLLSQSPLSSWLSPEKTNKQTNSSHPSTKCSVQLKINKTNGQFKTVLFIRITTKVISAVTSWSGGYYDKSVMCFTEFMECTVCVGAHCAVEDHTVSVAQALDVCCQVEADGSMTDGVHGLSIEEVVRSGWKYRKKKIFSIRLIRSLWVCESIVNIWHYILCVLSIRSERLCLFLSFLLLLRPALDGDSSFTLPWLDTLDELCELKWVGTWRASPPWDANVALQPPTTHCTNTDDSDSEIRCMFSYSSWWLSDLTSVM